MAAWSEAESLPATSTEHKAELPLLNCGGLPEKKHRAVGGLACSLVL